MVKYLIQQGADVHKAVPTKSGSSTPLEYACLSSTVWSAAENEFVQKPVTVGILKLLLAAGVDVNAADRNGFTALHNLLQRPAAPVEAVQLVIQQGANLSATDRLGRAPLMMCLNENSAVALPLPQIAALIKAGADCSRSDRAGVTPLQWCVVSTGGGRFKLLKMLLEGGVDVNYINSDDGQTALCKAVFTDNIEAVQVLLAAGSDVHHRDSRNMTPLFMVHSLPVLSLLLAAGADVHAVSNVGISVLHMVCGHVAPQATAAAVCGLIKAGVDVTARSSGPGGYTAAEVARHNGYTVIAQLLDTAERHYRAQAQK
jgi:ankyrin repeat protein